MNVGVDESGKKRETGEVDQLHAGGDFPQALDRRDALAANDDYWLADFTPVSINGQGCSECELRGVASSRHESADQGERQ
jgi:hypothetical protein